ncbi:thymidine phosphorylase [bacterium]|nr:thymidine phosphorylase [bacterium]
MKRNKGQKFFLRAKSLDIKTGYPWIIVIHEKDCRRYGIVAGDELSFHWKNKKTVVFVNVTETLIRPGYIGLFQEILKHYEIKNGELIELELVEKPKSIEAIQKKLIGKKLSYKEIYQIVSDIANYRLNDAEIAFFIAAAFAKRGFSRKEIYYLTKAMAYTGHIFNFGKLVADKHSTGGLPGNRVTPIIVAIVASCGITFPKTSSRAVTSAAGTADTFEVLAPVSFKIKEIEKIIKKINCCLVWGAEKIAPADDRIVKISYQLNIEPYTKMVVSIMSKKVAMGITHLIIDIPVGKTAKVPTMKKAHFLKNIFLYLGKKFKIKTKVLISRARGPIGKGIGPALEARDILRVMQQKKNRPMDLENKSIWLAGNLLELTGKIKKGAGEYTAREKLRDGSAWKKMQEIIKIQGGNPNIDSEEIELGKIKHNVYANKSGRISAIHNKNLAEICRLLGAPDIKKAGIYLHKTVGKKVKKGDLLFTLYTVSHLRLNLALEGLKKIWIFKIK